MKWLRLVRWKNLSIIVLTQWLCWWCIIVPNGMHGGIPTLLTPLHFWLLCASTVCIAAAGYIINDYFDVRIDAINQPQRVVLEKSIPRRNAIIAHTVLNILAITMSFMVAWAAGHYDYLLLQVVCIALLWFYSTRFKRQFVSGNVVVSLLTALTIAILAIYDSRALLGTTTDIDAYILLGYSVFAFLLNWMREIVKDMEDLKGDEAEACTTMPIKWGLKRSIIFTSVLGCITIALLLSLAIPALYGAVRITIYILAALVVPLAFWIVKLPASLTPKHFHLMSRSLKIIMLLGLGLLLIYRYSYA